MTYTFVEHTGELELQLEAPTLPELFAEAGRALAELMIENGGGPETVHVDLTVHARDQAALLVSWLDELIYRAETEHAVFTRFDITSLTDTDLAAKIHGITPSAFQSPVKAATYHRLQLASRGGAFTATVVLDV